jgi:transposase
MMGQQRGGQDRLFYSFNLEDRIPSNHLLRAIDHHLDLSGLRAHLADAYSATGRPSVDPELMLRMLIVGYCYGIRSERRLCEEVHLNLAYRWFCRLGLEDAVPDHSTFSKNRHGRFRESGTFRWLFERVVRQCMAAHLVKGEGFAVDASIVAADASRHPAVAPGQAIDWADKSEASRAVKEYLAGLDDEVAKQPASRTLSLSDPQARLTGATGEPSFFAYSTNYLIDTAHGVIVDVEATPAHRTLEVESTKIMVDRVEERFDLKPERLIGDTAYGTAPMLAWMVEEKGIEPHVPVWDRTGAPRRHPLQPGLRVERSRQRIPLPGRKALALRLAKAGAHAHHQGRHHHLPQSYGGLCRLSAEDSLLSQHDAPQDSPQHP